MVGLIGVRLSLSLPLHPRLGRDAKDSLLGLELSIRVSHMPELGETGMKLEARADDRHTRETAKKSTGSNAGEKVCLLGPVHLAVYPR